MSELTASVHRHLVRFLVSKAITCPNTGEVLDERTCVVLLDSDGDPAAVISQQGWANLVAIGNDALLEKTSGLVPDPTTVKAVKA